MGYNRELIQDSSTDRAEQANASTANHFMKSPASQLIVTYVMKGPNLVV